MILKKELLELIDQTEHIESPFHVIRDASLFTASNVICDIQEFDDWKQGLRLELYSILKCQVSSSVTGTQVSQGRGFDNTREQ